MDFTPAADQQSLKVKFQSSGKIAGVSLLINSKTENVDHKAGVVDVTQGVCNPDTSSAGVRVDGINLKEVTYKIPPARLVRNSIYTCQYDSKSGLVTVSPDTGKTSYCLYEGTVRFGQDKKKMTMVRKNYQAAIPVCSVSPGNRLEIWSRFDVRVGSCSISVSYPQHETKLHFDQQQKVLLLMNIQNDCIDKVIAYEENRYSDTMNCVFKQNVYTCTLSKSYCKTHQFDVNVTYKNKTETFIDSFKMEVKLVDKSFAHYDPGQNILRLGMFNMDKLFCYSKNKTIRIVNKDMMEDYTTTYTINKQTHQFELNPRENCKKRNVTVSLSDKFGSQIFKKDVMLPKSLNLPIHLIQEEWSTCNASCGLGMKNRTKCNRKEYEYETCFLKMCEPDFARDQIQPR